MNKLKTKELKIEIENILIRVGKNYDNASHPALLIANHRDELVDFISKEFEKQEKNLDHTYSYINQVAIPRTETEVRLSTLKEVHDWIMKNYSNTGISKGKSTLKRRVAKEIAIELAIGFGILLKE